MVSYGICQVSFVPMRKEPSHASEMVSQLIFGERYYVTDVNHAQTWYKIKTFADSYEGWIHAYNLYPLSDEEWLKHQNSKVVVLGSVITNVKLKNCYLEIPLGSLIYEEKDRKYFVGRLKFSNLTVNDDYLMVSGHQLLTYYVKKLLHTPYLWGGKTVWGFDCSGFTQILYRTKDIWLPRDAWQQAELGVSIPFEDRQRGDLAFFTDEQNKVTHVGLLLDDKVICHASGKVRTDFYDEKGIFRPKISTYTHQNMFIKRIESTQSEKNLHFRDLFSSSKSIQTHQTLLF